MNDRTQLLVGLPESGKSTFIGALAYIARKAKAPLMRLANLGPNDERVNRLSNNWLSYEAPERTHRAGEETVALSLVDSETKQTCTLALPDLAGESFERQWRDRECTPSYFEIASQTNSVLLFVHAGRIVEPTRIETALAIDQGTEPEGTANGQVAASETEDHAADDDVPPPTQVALVDLLQCLVNPPFAARKLTVGVLISAWDIVARLQQRPGEPERSPDEWIKTRLPLLDQYIRSSPDIITSKVWGVSAQGVDYEDEAALEEVKESVRKPEERIRLVSDQEEPTNDLTTVVAWLLRTQKGDPGAG